MPSALFDGKPSAVEFPDYIKKQVQVCAIWVKEDINNPYFYYQNVLKSFKNRITLPINNIDAKKALLLSLEGGSPIEENIDRLYDIKKHGISSVMLTWNSNNSLAGGALDSGQLTEKGKRAIEILNKLGMALDISHLNDKSAYKALEYAETPLASHSNCRSVCRHKRNLPDDALKLIRDKSGIIGINFYPSFLGEGNTFSNILCHIKYMLDLDLENAISIGSDFDGGDMNKSLYKTTQIKELYVFLNEEIQDTAIVNKIFFENAFNFYQKLFDKWKDML